MLHRSGTRLTFAVGVLLVALALLAGGCGGGGGGGSSSPSVSLGGSGGGTGGGEDAFVGNRNCEQCHTSFPSNGFTAGDPVETRAPYTDANTGIGTAYSQSVHNSPSFSPTSSDYVKCEDCHGAGRQHFGTGPIANWAPTTAQCGVCHKSPHFDLASFQASSHNNSDQNPDAAFFQGGPGTSQAVAKLPPTYTEDGALFRADGTTPVTKSQHIEECASCHSYAEETRPEHIAQGNLSMPQVGCSSCHDSHSPALRNQPDLATREVGPDQVLRFKPVRVNNNDMAAEFGARNTVTGTWIRPTLHFIYNVLGMPNDPGYANQLISAGDHLRLSSERLCASCHTQGTLKYSRVAVGQQSGQVAYDKTHNKDIFTQFRNSGHGDPDQFAFHEFSLLDPVNPNNTSGMSGHRPVYPVDMGLTDGRVPDPNDATKKLGANNYACNQCHHGIAAIDYIDGVQGDMTLDGATDSKAHILWGDSTVTCITCHDPHKDANPGTKNVRVPKYLSYSSWFNDTNNPGHGNKRGGLNKMLDGTDIPANLGGNQICLDCHQGRESGYTVYRNLLARNPSVDLYSGPLDSGAVTGNASNAHYFSGGAHVYSKNLFEYDASFGTVGTYSNGVPEHVQEGCIGCHMPEAKADGTEGGHTWKPRIESCRECHAGIPDFLSVTAPQNVDGDATTTTVYQKLGTIDGAATPAITDKGLFNILRYVLFTRNIRYNPDVYPYFSRINGKANFTKAEFVACFNLGAAYKSGNAAYVHNYYYVSQVMIDALKTLGVTTNPNTGQPFVRPETPAGGSTRPASDNRDVVIP